MTTAPMERPASSSLPAAPVDEAALEPVAEAELALDPDEEAVPVLPDEPVVVAEEPFPLLVAVADDFPDDEPAAIAPVSAVF